MIAFAFQLKHDMYEYELLLYRIIMCIAYSVSEHFSFRDIYRNIKVKTGNLIQHASEHGCVCISAVGTILDIDVLPRTEFHRFSFLISSECAFEFQENTSNASTIALKICLANVNNDDIYRRLLHL